MKNVNKLNRKRFQEEQKRLMDSAFNKKEIENVDK